MEQKNLEIENQLEDLIDIVNNNNKVSSSKIEKIRKSWKRLKN